MRIAVAGATGNIGGATHTPLRPTRRERPTRFSLDSRNETPPGLVARGASCRVLLVSVPVVMSVAVVVRLPGGLLDNGRLGR
jgi:uncharacterized protein YbjT (DUF2867 family)